ncbi:MAG: hypothetical protein COA99_19770 [Moraxellaceae bacterium]|nr:MAG: hypothetical protein COA99_19770 [Moraxellaceae bacterium]
MDIQKKFGFIFVALILSSSLVEFALQPLLEGSAVWRLSTNIILLTIFSIVVYTGLTKPIGKLSAKLQALTNGDECNLEFRLQHSGKVDQNISQSLNHVLVRKQAAFKNIADSVARLDPISQELRDSYSSMSQKSAMQNNHSEVVRQSMAKIQMATGSVSDHVKEISTTAATGKEVTNHAEQLMLDTVNSINGLAGDMSIASSEITALKEGSDKIHTILEVIQSIAEQTNLLALNAAIEAARAGEHGRGFAVVAGEVRTLSERTRKSASEVEQMIRELQSGITRVVEAMGVSISRTEETVEKTDNSRAQLEHIHDIIERIDTVAQQVEQSMEHQVTASREAEESVQAMAELNALALQETNIQPVTPDDVFKLYQALRDKLENHGYSNDDWTSSRRGDIRLETTATKTVNENTVELF